MKRERAGQRVASPIDERISLATAAQSSLTSRKISNPLQTLAFGGWNIFADLNFQP